MLWVFGPTRGGSRIDRGVVGKIADWTRVSTDQGDSVSTLTVIIPTLNEERYVGALLSDVASQTRKANEVLVVDAGSTDGTMSVVRRFPSVKVLEGTPPVACGRHVGGRSATGDVLIFLDADVRLP